MSREGSDERDGKQAAAFSQQGEESPFSASDSLEFYSFSG
jgi:hypothetical protein